MGTIRNRTPELSDRCLRKAFTGLGWLQRRVESGLDQE